MHEDHRHGAAPAFDHPRDCASDLVRIRDHVFSPMVRHGCAAACTAGVGATRPATGAAEPRRRNDDLRVLVVGREPKAHGCRAGLRIGTDLRRAALRRTGGDPQPDLFHGQLATIVLAEELPAFSIGDGLVVTDVEVVVDAGLHALRVASRCPRQGSNRLPRAREPGRRHADRHPAVRKPRHPFERLADESPACR